MKIYSNVKAGYIGQQHNEKLLSNKKSKSLAIKTGIKAGEGNPHNHNEKLASDKKRFTVKTGVKAGGQQDFQHNEKLAGDNSNAIEQKSFGKKLRLSKETIRNLKDGNILKDFDLKRIAGGVVISRRPDCSCIYYPLTY